MRYPRSAVLVHTALALLVVGPTALARAETLSDVQDQLERRSAQLAAARTAAESGGSDSARDAALARRLERQKSRLIARASVLAREAARAAHAVAAAVSNATAASPAVPSSEGFVVAELSASPFGVSSLLPGVGGLPSGTHVFPIAGASTFSDDWRAPWSGRALPRGHRPLCRPRYAGRRRRGRDASFASATAASAAIACGCSDGAGTAFFYAHLDGYSAAAREGATSVRGTVLGFTGDTGDAKGTSPHVHFQIHPGDGEPVQPYPIVSAWPRLAAGQA